MGKFGLEGGNSHLLQVKVKKSILEALESKSMKEKISVPDLVRNYLTYHLIPEVIKNYTQEIPEHLKEKGVKYFEDALRNYNEGGLKIINECQDSVNNLSNLMEQIAMDLKRVNRIGEDFINKYKKQLKAGKIKVAKEAIEDVE